MRNFGRLRGRGRLTEENIREALREVRIALPNGQTLCALAEPLDLRTRGLTVEQAVQVQFSPSNVLLGTPL